MMFDKSSLINFVDTLYVISLKRNKEKSSTSEELHYQLF